MTLSDADILFAIKSTKAIVIHPFNPDQLQPASYDLTLGPEILSYKRRGRWGADKPIPHLRDHLLMDAETISSAWDFVLEPGMFVLGATAERIEVPANMSAKLEGKSSIARVGVFVHVTAGFIDPGFKGQITIEMYNASPIPRRLRLGDRIAQIAFQMLSSTAHRPYGHKDLGSRYQNQIGTTPTRQ